MGQGITKGEKIQFCWEWARARDVAAADGSIRHLAPLGTGTAAPGLVEHRGCPVSFTVNRLGAAGNWAQAWITS